MTGTGCSETWSHPFSPQTPEPVGPDALTACLELDRKTLGGFWSTTQWQQELGKAQSITIGHWDPSHTQLLSLASGWLVAGELQLMFLAVAPEQRRCGLGRQILISLLEEAKRLGCSSASLEVAAGNRPACQLYQQVGFINCGQRSGYYRNGEDALLKWLDLKQIQRRADNRTD